MIHLLAILLNAMRVIHLSWIIVLLPEIIIPIYLMVGITWMLIVDYKAEREKKKGLKQK